eukprot:GHUV01050819.1.p1 GENE.GHUV01050819.1~~GHUV01050819.1.p1  ORF type:complete len:130 (-),score=18.48 GHUV01050819.1:187-576(-)
MDLSFATSPMCMATFCALLLGCWQPQLHALAHPSHCSFHGTIHDLEPLYATQVCGYTGPIYMTYPTRAIAPLMLEDYHRVLMDRPGSGPLFAKHHIAACMAKVSLLDLQETVQVGGPLSCISAAVLFGC